MTNDVNVLNQTPSGRPTAVIVTRRSGQEGPVKAELESDGWSVKVCDGPGRRPCPLMQAEPCLLRESADAAVVFVEPKEPSVGSLPRLRCAADRSSPGVVALEGCVDLPRFSGTTAIVGALRRPRAVVSAISELLAAAPDPDET